MDKIGFGGSCHWCTEAIFSSLKGVNMVAQGWISSSGGNEALSEAVIVEFNPEEISLAVLIAVHLHTHSCTSLHTFRSKYRSAIYTFTENQAKSSGVALEHLQQEFDQPIITCIMPFQTFKLNTDNYLNYYYSNPAKPFCQNVVNPKLRYLFEKFAAQVAPHRLQHIASLRSIQ